MKKLQDDGRYADAPYEQELLAFEFEGTEIRNPYESECGRFEVDPKSYGFVEHHTGGGCMALLKDLGDGAYLLITDSDGCAIPEKGDDGYDMSDICIGRFNVEGEQLAYISLADLPAEE